MSFEAYLLKQLRLEVRNCKPGDPLYKILKEELSLRGLWVAKGKPRGRAFPTGAENPAAKKKRTQ